MHTNNEGGKLIAGHDSDDEASVLSRGKKAKPPPPPLSYPSIGRGKPLAKPPPPPPPSMTARSKPPPPPPPSMMIGEYNADNDDDLSARFDREGSRKKKKTTKKKDNGKDDGGADDIALRFQRNKAELEAAFDKDVFREKESQVIPKRSLFGGLGSYYEDNELSVSDDEEEIDTEEGIDALRLKKLKEKERAHYEKQLGIDLKGIQTEPWGAADMEDNIRMKYYKALLRANKEKQEEEEDEGDEEDADYKRRRSSSMRKTSERIRDNVSLGILQDDGENTDDVVEKMVIPESEKQYLSEWRITKQDPDDLHRVYRPNIGMKRNRELFENKLGY